MSARDPIPLYYQLHCPTGYSYSFNKENESLRASDCVYKACECFKGKAEPDLICCFSHTVKVNKKQIQRSQSAVHYQPLPKFIAGTGNNGEPTSMQIFITTRPNQVISLIRKPSNKEERDQ